MMADTYGNADEKHLPEKLEYKDVTRCRSNQVNEPYFNCQQPQPQPDQPQHLHNICGNNDDDGAPPPLHKRIIPPPQPPPPATPTTPTTNPFILPPPRKNTKVPPTVSACVDGGEYGGDISRVNQEKNLNSHLIIRAPDSLPPIPPRVGFDQPVNYDNSNSSTDDLLNTYVFPDDANKKLSFANDYGDGGSQNQGCSKTVGTLPIRKPREELLSDIIEYEEFRAAAAEGEYKSRSCRPLPPPPTPLITRVSLAQVETIYTTVEDNEPWFHGDVDRDTSEKILMGYLEEVGTFLVRNKGGSNPDPDPTYPFCISVVFDGKIFHLPVRLENDRTFSLGKRKEEDKKFSTLQELVSFYTINMLTIMEKNTGHFIGECKLVHVLSKSGQK